ncbi:MAG: hypothetical protein K6F94_01475 [Bacteroidaceae bacterium]|nr:hypothetical protein [Bacteroidaceae bacterium]
MRKYYIAPQTINVELLEGDDITQSLVVMSGQGKQVADEEDIFVKEEYEESRGSNVWSDDWQSSSY